MAYYRFVIVPCESLYALGRGDALRTGFGRWVCGLTGGFLLLQNFSVAPEFQCCYFCESSCLFYLSFNFDFYVSKIMHL